MTDMQIVRFKGKRRKSLSLGKYMVPVHFICGYKSYRIVGEDPAAMYGAIHNNDRIIFCANSEHHCPYFEGVWTGFRGGNHGILDSFPTSDRTKILKRMDRLLEQHSHDHRMKAAQAVAAFIENPHRQEK